MTKEEGPRKERKKQNGLLSSFRLLCFSPYSYNLYPKSLLITKIDVFDSLKYKIKNPKKDRDENELLLLFFFISKRFHISRDEEEEEEAQSAAGLISPSLSPSLCSYPGEFISELPQNSNFPVKLF